MSKETGYATFADMENLKTDPAARNPGATLRSLRLAKGWTLADVSRLTGLTVSTLSKVESGKMSLSYDKMVRIATGLGIDIGVLFASPSQSKSGTATEFAPSGRRSIARKGDGRIIETANSLQLYPAADLLNKQLVPIIAEVKARSLKEYGELLRHAGEEFVFVLSGAIELHTEFYAPTLLQEGDSIYFDSGMAHGYVAAAEGPCRMLSVMTTADWAPELRNGSAAVESSGPPTLQVIRAG
ncbi:MAG: XRE family transcriptional regulator [Alphaproteobacteria bacterium]|nr:XRE family transcriptional regulator [Alphaproteobacteria bacterium]